MSDRHAVLIGGGIIGTLSALSLLERGWAVTVVEGAHVGAGSSSRTAAGIRQQFSTRETVLGMRYAVGFYRDWAERVGGQGVPIHQNGYLFLYADEPGWTEAQRRVQKQHGWGLSEVEALDAAAVSERFPWVDPETILGATWGPTDGFLRPEMVYNDAADAIRRQGGRILQQKPVVGARHEGPRIAALTLSDGSEVAGDLYFDCTNAWTRALASRIGATDLPIAALKRYLWFVERDGSLSSEQLLSMPLTVSPSGAYCRPENAGSLLMGWKHEAPDLAPDFDDEEQDRIEPEFFHKSGVDARPFEAWMALAEVMPALGEFAGITATTGGFYGTTPDHNPFLDYDPQVANLVRLVGFSGHGAMLGPFVARIAAALAEAGGTIDTVEVLGEHAELSCFHIGREFGHSESMVI